MLESDANLELVRKLKARIDRHKACKGYGYLTNDKGAVEDCECRRESMFKFRMARSGIPPRFQSKSFADYLYKNGASFKKVQEYLRNHEQNREDGVGMFLYGPSYTGKSLLACSSLIELMKMGYDCKFIYFQSMLEGDSNDKFLSVNWDFLYVEGVAEVLESLTNFREGNLTGQSIHGAIEFLGNMLSRRADAKRPTILTSTAGITTWNEKFPRLAATLIGNCMQVDCEDKGFRKRKLEQMMEGDDV